MDVCSDLKLIASRLLVDENEGLLCEKLCFVIIFVYFHLANR